MAGSSGPPIAAQIVTAAQGQVSFVVPSDAPDGLMIISVTDSTGATATTVAKVVRCAPALFASNANGQGAAAGFVRRIAPDGGETVANTASWDAASGSYFPAPIPAGSERLVLSLYATGLRHRTAATNVTATVAAMQVPVSYAGAQPDYPGLDQVDLELPGSLAGAGVVEIVLTVDGQASNAVSVDFE